MPSQLAVVGAGELLAFNCINLVITVDSDGIDGFLIEVEAEEWRWQRQFCQLSAYWRAMNW